jgi:ribosomal-protein-alanine N-acetyltransferase
MRRLLMEHPDETGFGSWYIVAQGRLVGICGYKGPPNAAGEVKIGYSVIAAGQRRGFATGAVRLLIARAFRDPRVTTVAAETLPSLIASQ